MKILLVVTKSDIGGAQVFVLNLARAFKELNCEIEVAAGEGSFLFNELKKYDINYYYLQSLKRDLNLFNAIYFVCELRKLIKLNKYNIIHLNSSNTLIGGISTFMLKNKPKTFFTFHGLSFIDRNYNPSYILKFLAKIYYRFLLKSVNKIIFECKSNLQEVIDAGMIDDAPVIYNGIDGQDLHFKSRAEVRSYFSQICKSNFDNSFLIGSTGRLIYQKNFEFLISIFPNIKKIIPNAKLIIIGEGPDRRKYYRMISESELPNDIFLIGELKNSYQYMKGFDLFTLASRYEGVSISLIEAIYANVPILATKVGGNVDIVDNDERQLFTLDNREEYIQKLNFIKLNGNTIIQNHIKMKEIFSLKNMVNNYKQLFESEINN